MSTDIWARLVCRSVLGWMGVVHCQLSFDLGHGVYFSNLYKASNFKQAFMS